MCIHPEYRELWLHKESQLQEHAMLCYFIEYFEREITYSSSEIHIGEVNVAYIAPRAIYETRLEELH